MLQTKPKPLPGLSAIVGRATGASITPKSCLNTYRSTFTGLAGPNDARGHNPVPVSICSIGTTNFTWLLKTPTARITSQKNSSSMAYRKFIFRVTKCEPKLSKKIESHQKI